MAKRNTYIENTEQSLRLREKETRPDQQKDNDNNNDKDCLLGRGPFFRSFQLTVSWKIWLGHPCLLCVSCHRSPVSHVCPLCPTSSLAHPSASGSRARACFFYPESLNENFNLWTEELFCRTPSSSQPPERKYLHFVNLIRCQLWPVHLYRLIW